MIALALTEKTRYHLSHMTRQDLSSHQCNPPQGRSLTEQDPFGSASLLVSVLCLTYSIDIDRFVMLPFMGGIFDCYFNSHCILP